eukprot:UN17870
MASLTDCRTSTEEPFLSEERWLFRSSSFLTQLRHWRRFEKFENLYVSVL